MKKSNSKNNFELLSYFSDSPGILLADLPR